MKYMCAFSVAARLAFLTFLTGLVIGLVVGYQLAAPDPATVGRNVPANGSPALGLVDLHRHLHSESVGNAVGNRCVVSTPTLDC
jgi:hypothetical protein